jgi:hypothetical protein
MMWQQAGQPACIFVTGLMHTLRADLVIRDPEGIHGGGIPSQFNFE